MRVVNWINEFNPSNVNNDDLKLPPELKVLEDRTKMLIRDYPARISVNNASFN